MVSIFCVCQVLCGKVVGVTLSDGFLILYTYALLSASNKYYEHTD